MDIISLLIRYYNDSLVYEINIGYQITNADNSIIKENSLLLYAMCGATRNPQRHNRTTYSIETINCKQLRSLNMLVYTYLEFIM